MPSWNHALGIVIPCLNNLRCARTNVAAIHLKRAYEKDRKQQDAGCLLCIPKERGKGGGAARILSRGCVFVLISAKRAGKQSEKSSHNT